MRPCFLIASAWIPFLYTALSVRAAERTVGERLREQCSAWKGDETGASVVAGVRGLDLSYEGDRLVADLSRPHVVDEGPLGVVEVFPGEPDRATAPLPREEAARLMEAYAAGRIGARAAFLPEQGALTGGTPCLLLSGGRITRVRVIPLWVSLEIEGKERVRLYTERGSQISPNGPPEVVFGSREATFDGEPQDPSALVKALAGLQRKATACYQRALTQNPGIFGTVIVGMEVERDGRIGEPRVEVDAIGEPPLSRCLRELFTHARVSQVRRGGHLSLPMHLRFTVRHTPR